MRDAAARIFHAAHHGPFGVHHQANDPTNRCNDSDNRKDEDDKKQPRGGCGEMYERMFHI